MVKTKFIYCKFFFGDFKKGNKLNFIYFVIEALFKIEERVLNNLLKV